MSEHQAPQPEKTKKPYATPQLTVYGDVEDLTRGGTTIRNTDANSTPDPGPLVPRRGRTPTPTKKP